MEQVHREWKDKGLAVVAINIQESAETVRAWVTESKVSFTVLLDPEGRVVQAYGVTVTPTVFILGRDGKLVGRAVGTKAWTSDKGRALLRALHAP